MRRSKDTVALKYFYQHDPTLAPYSYSSVPGFTEHLDSGSQVASIINTYLVKSNLSTTENDRDSCARRPGRTTSSRWGRANDSWRGSGNRGVINTFGSNYFPGVSIFNVLGDNKDINDFPGSNSILNIGPNAEGQAIEYGRVPEPDTAVGGCGWTLGKHTVSFGGELQLHAAEHDRQAHERGHDRDRTTSARSCRAM